MSPFPLQITVIRKLRPIRPEGAQILFNNLYSSSNPMFNTEPNALLVSVAEGRKAGRALDVAMGQGRNAVFLARRGWDVTGFDVSEKGIAIARENAAAAGVKLTTLQDTMEKFDYGRDRWDLIALMYTPAPVTESDYIRRLDDALRSRGVIVLEHFAADWGPEGRRVTSSGAFAIDPKVLNRGFGRFQILRLEDTVAKADWSPGEARVVRLVAAKKQ